MQYIKYYNGYRLHCFNNYQTPIETEKKPLKNIFDCTDLLDHYKFSSLNEVSGRIRPEHGEESDDLYLMIIYLHGIMSLYLKQASCNYGQLVLCAFLNGN